MKQSRWHILGFFTIALLWACGGGAGGPGAALDGGAAGGGPVGGGNFAAGPMSLPAPSVVAPDNPVVWANISCTNIPGEDFECRGTDNSVSPPPLTKEMRFKIYAPGAAVPKRDPFTAPIDGNGAWYIKEKGEAGDSVEICPVNAAGNCDQMRILKLPPEGGVVEGNSGTMKNLVIDPSGNAWHSRLLPKVPSLGRLIASLFISEARAEVLQPYTPVACGDYYTLDFVSGGTDAAPKTQCTLYQSARGSNVSLQKVHFDDCAQSDIRSIVSLRHPRSGQPVLLVAVKNKVHVVETQPSPRIVWAYSFPGDVVSILDMGGRFIAVAKAPTGMTHHLYYVDLRRDTSEGTGCYPALDWLNGLENVTSSDQLSEAFTAVVYKNSGQYQVMLGRLVPGLTKLRNSPVTLLSPSTTPLEARLLKVEQNWVWVAVLNAAEKKITVVKRYMPDTDVLLLPGAGEADQVQNIGLEGLPVGGGVLSVNRPHLFNVNRNTNEMVFVDISELSSKFVVLPYAWASGNFAPPTLAAVTDLKGASPASLRYDTTAGQAGWTYDDTTMQFRRVRTERETTQIQVSPSLLLSNESLIQYYQNKTTDNPGSEEEEE